MKRLLLMRHAEAAGESYGQTDRDRPLTIRGESEAIAMGRTLFEAGSLPGAIVVSPAERAVRTAELFIEGADLNIEPRLDETIYEATPQMLFEIASQFDDDLESVMMVGHNPGFESFAAHLTGSLMPMRPGAVAAIDLQITQWEDLRKNCGKIAPLSGRRHDARNKY